MIEAVALGALRTIPWDVALSVATGSLTLSTLTGLTGSGNGTDALNYQGTLAAVNLALRGLTYIPAADSPAVTMLNVDVQTLDEGGAGGPG